MKDTDTNIEKDVSYDVKIGTANRSDSIIRFSGIGENHPFEAPVVLEGRSFEYRHHYELVRRDFHCGMLIDRGVKMVELVSRCICCTLQIDLRKQIETLVDQINPRWLPLAENISMK
jgi:hypothetical protein